jgi:hypothetical protein
LTYADVTRRGGSSTGVRVQSRDRLSGLLTPLIARADGGSSNAFHRRCLPVANRAVQVVRNTGAGRRNQGIGRGTTLALASVYAFSPRRARTVDVDGCSQKT